MFKGNIPSTHHATSPTWSKWVALIMQQAQLGKPNRLGILEEIMDWPEGRHFGALPEEVAHAQEAPLYNELSEDGRHHALFTDGSCCIVGNHRKWKAAVWSPHMTSRGGYSSGRRPIGSTGVNPSELLHCGRTSLPGNEQVDKAVKVEVAKVDLDWERKGELFVAQWAHKTLGHLGRDETYRWARDQGVELTMEAITQVTHECETCAAIKQATQGLGFQYGEAWQIDYIGPLPPTCQGKHYTLTMVEATTGWLETYPVNHATAQNNILGLEKQIVWQRGIPERIESDSGTHFQNNLINSWAKKHSTEFAEEKQEFTKTTDSYK
ncbi:hypothetical protein QYF61_023276, partial [Mycteria americana]